MNEILQELYGKFVIVRSRNQGVVTGFLRAVQGQQAAVAEARQLHYWEGANTLFEASLHGVDNARISEPVDLILMTEICGVLPCTEKATENLRQSRWNKPYKHSGSKRHKTKQPG